MAIKIENYAKKGLRSSYASTIIGISLVLFMIGLVLGGVLALRSIEKQAKENLQGDIFFKSELNDEDIVPILELRPDVVVATDELKELIDKVKPLVVVASDELKEPIDELRPEVVVSTLELNAPILVDMLELNVE